MVTLGPSSSLQKALLVYVADGDDNGRFVLVPNEGTCEHPLTASNFELFLNIVYSGPLADLSQLPPTTVNFLGYVVVWTHPLVRDRHNMVKTQLPPQSQVDDQGLCNVQVKEAEDLLPLADFLREEQLMQRCCKLICNPLNLQCAIQPYNGPLNT